MAQNNKQNTRNKQVKSQNKKNLQSAMKKKTAEKKSSSCCCWVLGSILLISAIAGVIIYDTQANGNGVFEKSAFGQVLKNAGALPYVETAWYKTMSTLARAYKWSEENLPIHWAKIKEFSIPYVELLLNLLKIIKNSMLNIWETLTTFIAAKTPVVCNFIEQYIPGFCKKVSDIYSATWDISVNLFNNLCEFFRTKVFVGSLSPENLRKSLNQTQIAAAKYYSMFHQKVDVYSKIQ